MNQDIIAGKVSMKIHFRRMWGLLGIVPIFILSSCARQNLPTHLPTEEILIATETPTIEPTHSPQLETVIFQQTGEGNLVAFPYPNLWTRIDKSDITIYPYDVISDYTYDKDGSLWIVGGFGVLHRKSNGEQTVYSIKNGLSRQFFTRVAISPTGEVWVGGTDNALFRFDGAQWIDEGKKLPSPENQKGWLCASLDISGIDFDVDGSAWIMNNGINIYTQVYGQWVNFPFPKNLLPIAGGGGCPIGLRVLSENDITIMRSGCCMNPPVGYHFDGEKWEDNTNYSIVEELLFNRHQVNLDEFYTSLRSIQYNTSVFSDYLSFSKDNLLHPYLYPRKYEPYLITSDKTGVVWINEGVELYNNSSGTFDTLQHKSKDGSWTATWREDPDLPQSALFDFGTQIIYYQEERRPYLLDWVFRDSDIGWTDTSHAAIGKDNQVWVVSRQDGVMLVDHGNIKTIDRIPDVLATSQLGGVYIFQDGRLWIGSTGEIWEYQNGNWRQYIIPNTEELFTDFVEDGNGIVYGATDTSVYRFENETYSSKQFVNQVNKTLVESDEADCIVHKHYATCPTDIFSNLSGDFYKSAYLGIQDNGTVFYVNNRIIAKFENEKWKSFFFDTFTIDSATVDKNGYVWLFSNLDGLFRLAPDTFDAYQEILH